MEPLFSASQYLNYLWKAKGANGIHSPFVFEWYNEVLAHPYYFYAFEEIENERNKLLLSKEKLEYQDLGANKRIVKTTVSSLASQSIMPTEAGILLFQLSFWLKPETVVELGTSLGITTAYLAKAHPANITTFEGILAIGETAKTVWNNLDIKDIRLVHGKIEETLPVYLKSANPTIDLLILDANHSYEATMQNFNRALPYLHENSCLVVDDLYWSRGMAKAWEEIKNHPEVRITIDLFRLGLVFFRKENLKENFIIRW